MARIGFDAKRAAQNRTGLGNYSRFVIEMLLKYAPGNEYLFYIPSERKNKLLNIDALNVKNVYPQSVWKKLASIWRVWGIKRDIRRDSIDLFHGLSNELPLNIHKQDRARSIVTIHDLIFLKFPEYYKPIDRWIYNFKFRRACINADRIIAVSECTKRDIISCYGIAEDKIDVVYQGCDELFAKVAPEEKKSEVRMKYGLPEKYILYLGSIEERKNLLQLAKALNHLKSDLSVVAVGKRTPYAKLVDDYVQQNNLSDRFMMIHNAPFADLPSLYQMSSVFVYTSFYEGFGIPILEALNSGVPVIAATGSCLEEAGGEGTIYVSPTDEKELAARLDEVLNDEALRSTMIEKGKEYASRFTMDKLVGSLLDVYGKVLK